MSQRCLETLRTVTGYKYLGLHRFGGGLALPYELLLDVFQGLIGIA